MLQKETRQKKNSFKRSLKDSGILAMRKFIFPVIILLLPVISVSMGFAQNSIRVYSTDASILKYFKFDKPGAKKDFYVQLSDNITNVQQYYPPHLAYFRFDYRTSQIVSNSHNGSLGNSPQLCLPGGYDYGYVNQFKISARDTNVMFAHTVPSSCFEPADGLGVSTNNGANWSNVYSNGFTMPLFMGLDIDPSTDSIMYCIYRPIGQSSYSLFQTTNKGQSWQNVFVFSTISLTDYTNCLISVSAFNHNVIFVKSSNGLVRSSDFGNTFSNISMPSVDIKSFEYDKVDNTIYFTTKNNTPGIFKSTNEGLNWVQIFIKPCQSMEIDPSDNNILYAGSTDGLYRSTNKGLNWTLYNNSFVQSKNVIGVSKSASMGDTIIVVTDKAIYKVHGEFKSFTDHAYFPLKVGNTWKYRTEVLFPPEVTYSQVTIISDTVINNIRYYKTHGTFPGFTGNLITMDSLSGNIFCYSETPGCQRYPQRLLIDSLAGRLGDSVHRCHNPSIGIIMDTSDFSLPWQTVKSKTTYYSSLVDESNTYGKNFGLVERMTAEGFPIYTRLIGCRINNIGYGDTTSLISTYKPYFPLSVGHTWVYKVTSRVFPDPPVVSYRKVQITGDSTINGIRYFITSALLPSFSNNLVTMDTLTGNILCYAESPSCSLYPNRKLIDSLAAGIGDTVRECSSGINGLGLDTNDINLFGQTVKSKNFKSPTNIFGYIGHKYANGFGLVNGTFLVEEISVQYELLGCTISGTLYGDTTSVTSQSISGTIKFSDNNQPASNGYVKALKLNASTGNVITYDSTQIGTNGTYNLYVPPDLYYIVAYPNSEKQADFIPTYYPSTINWQSAVKVNSSNNPSNVNISVYRKNIISGAYSVNGWITAQTNISLAGINDAIVYIKQGNVFRDYFITQNLGQYNLNSLLSGNYEIVADRLGFVSAQQNVSFTNGNLENINFALVRVGIQNITNVIPDKYSLYQNYPNPFNPVTNIKFDIPKSSFVTIKIYDILGKESVVLLNESKAAGSYKIDFDASSLTSGVYFYRLETESFTETKRMVILK